MTWTSLPYNTARVMELSWVMRDRAKHRYCEAPRHEGQKKPSAYVEMILGGPEGNIMQTTCEECHVAMVGDGADPAKST